MAEPEERRCFHLGWSAYRRAHQAVAVRCKKASRTARALRERAFSEDRSGPESIMPPPEGAPLTDTEWEKVEPLLPPQRFTGGRPYHDHRT